VSNRAWCSSRASRAVCARIAWNASVVLLGLLLASCEFVREPALVQIDLIPAPTQLEPQPKVIVPPHTLPLDYDVTNLCALIPAGYREDALREAMVDSSGDTVRVRAELRLGDGRVLETHFAYFAKFKGNNYYCLGPGSTRSEGDAIRTERPLPTVRTLRVWSNRPLLLGRLQWHASNAL